MIDAEKVTQKAEAYGKAHARLQVLAEVEQDELVRECLLSAAANMLIENCEWLLLARRLAS